MLTLIASVFVIFVLVVFAFAIMACWVGGESDDGMYNGDE